MPWYQDIIRTINKTLNRRHKFTQQHDPVRHAIDQDALVERMGALPDGSQSIERGHAERSREVAVGPAPGGRFFQFNTQFGSQSAGLAEERSYPSSALQGRT